MVFGFLQFSIYNSRKIGLSYSSIIGSWFLLRQDVIVKVKSLDTDSFDSSWVQQLAAVHLWSSSFILVNCNPQFRDDIYNYPVRFI